MSQGIIVNHVPIVLPRLVGTRGAATRLLASFGSALDGASVSLFGRDLVDSSPSFTDEMVAEFQAHNVGEVVVYPSPDDFVKQLTAAAHERDFSRVRMATPDEIKVL